MGDNIKALTEVYVALGGNASDIPAGASNADIIALIATVASGGGGAGLPAVTSEDNGDVLTVVNGAWGKAAPSGGGVFDVEYEVGYDDNDQLVVTCNHTAAEIMAAHTDGRIITMKTLFYQTAPYHNAVGSTVNNFEGMDIIESKYIVGGLVEGQPTSDDVIVFAYITWNGGYQRWQYSESVYSLTPAT